MILHSGRTKKMSLFVWRMKLSIISLFILSIYVPFTLSQDPGFGSASYVLIIGVDGLSSAYFNSTSTHPNLDKLISTGASSMQARVSFPSESKPNWEAVLASGGFYQNITKTKLLQSNFYLFIIF